MTTFFDWNSLPAGIRTHLGQIEQFIGVVDGKTIAIPTDGNTFIDDGIIDADDAVQAVNGIVDEFKRLQAEVGRLNTHAESFHADICAENDNLRYEIEQLKAEVLKWQVEAGKFGPGMV